MNTSNNRRLFIIGGAADTCYSIFLEQAGGKDARILVLGHASGEPRKAAERVKASLVALGASSVTVMTPRSKGEIGKDIDAIFMAGGDQERLVKLLDKQGLGEQLREAFRRGVLICGTSAGAAACSSVMITGGMSDAVLQRGSLLLGKGLCLLPNIVVDTHFAQRNRFNRLRAAVATLPLSIAIGLDEDTGLLIKGDMVRVAGAGNVYICVSAADQADGDWDILAKTAHLTALEKDRSYSLPEHPSFVL